MAREPKQMPKMPSPPSQNAAVEAAEGSDEVQAPVGPPETFLPEAKAPEVKPVVKKVGPPIQVVATRQGFYKQSRRLEGEKFTIEGEHHLGSWMKKI